MVPEESSLLMEHRYVVSEFSVLLLLQYLLFYRPLFSHAVSP